MNIRDATRRYEAWLGARIPLIAEDLRAKHEAMARDAFSFLRATFYRWAQVWPETCPDLAAAPRVLAVALVDADAARPAIGCDRRLEAAELLVECVRRHGERRR